MSESEENDFEIDQDILSGFIVEVQDDLNTLDEKFIHLEKNPSDKSNVDDIFRVIHSVKGNAGFFNLKSIKVLSHKVENLLDELRQGKRSVSKEAVDILLAGIDFLKVLFQDLSENLKPRNFNSDESSYLESLEKFLDDKISSGNSIYEEILIQIKPDIEAIAKNDDLNKNAHVQNILNHTNSYYNQEKVQETKVPEKESPEPSKTENNKDEQPSEKRQESVQKTMRIKEETVDGFMKYIGELIISGEVFNNIQKRFENKNLDSAIAKEFKNANLSFNQLSQNLQKSLMDIRLLPIKKLYSKVPRLVRDLAKTLDKKVDIKLEGDDVEIDKSLIESLEDPFIHMIRNSLDHGLETPDDRQKAGKCETGIVTIQAKRDKSFFYLTISDDGRGIDPQIIKKVAIKKGVVSQDKANNLSDHEIQNLIFAPGFSSAETISQVSGRGVGMDVVLTNIKNCNGGITVNSEVGKGTSMTIKLPLAATLVVVSGLLVQSGNETFILPLESVREVAETKKNMFATIQGCSKVITFRKKTYPAIHLKSLILGKDFDQIDLNNHTMLLVEKAGQQACILVDRLIGLQQVVLKNIGDEFKDVNIVSGCAILGDGKIGLVLDIKGVMERHSQLETLSIKNKAQTSLSNQHNTTQQI